MCSDKLKRLSVILTSEHLFVNNLVIHFLYYKTVIKCHFMNKLVKLQTCLQIVCQRLSLHSLWGHKYTHLLSASKFHFPCCKSAHSCGRENPCFYYNIPRSVVDISFQLLNSIHATISVMNFMTLYFHNIAQKTVFGKFRFRQNPWQCEIIANTKLAQIVKLVLVALSINIILSYVFLYTVVN